MTKPPYRIPSMREISEIPWNGYTAVSTFSGCGGSSLGYRMAGFRVLYANEFVEAAAETYAANAAPYTTLDTRDIRQITPDDILNAAGLDVGELDLLDGSPPCASFSTVGKREAAWGVVRPYSDTRQRVDDLFFEFARLLAGLRPRMFVAENVAGLVIGKARGYFKWILTALMDAGYRVAVRRLDAQWLGVPQSRNRLIFIGVREDLDAEPEHPKPLPYRYTARDALGDLPGAYEDLPEDPETGDPLSFRGYSIEPQWYETPPGKRHPKRHGLARMHWDLPAPTILAHAGATGRATISHPDYPRYPSIAELRRLSGFPDDFVLTGPYRKRWERIGRAVPPPMMAAVAEAVRGTLDRLRVTS